MKKLLLVLVLAVFAVFALTSCDKHEHEMTHHAAVSATCEATGKKEYWSCAGCEKLFADEAGETEVQEADLVVAALGHDLVEVKATESDEIHHGYPKHYECSRCEKWFKDAEGKQPTSAEELGLPLVDKLAVTEGALEDPEGALYFAVGGFEGSWGPSEDTLANGATSIAAVKALDEKLGQKLEALEAAGSLNALYYAVIDVANGPAGYTKNALYKDVLVQSDGAFTVKAIKGHYDETTENYITDTWIPDPKVCHVEPLTDNLFVAANWAEAKDEQGFDWTADPVVLGGAGGYYLIIVDYGKVSTTEVCGYGLGLIKAVDVKNDVTDRLPKEDKLATENGLSSTSNWYAVGGFGSWDPKEETLMTGSTTVAAVKALDAELGGKLEAKGSSLKSLYYKVVKLGTFDGGWSTNAKAKKAADQDPVLFSYNGSYTLKAIKGHYDEDTENHITDQWIPDPKTAHVECLTPETLFIAANWAEEKDADGFDWTANPVAIGGAGYYYMIVAEYAEVSAAEVYGYGLGLVKIFDLESSAPAPLELKDLVLADHTFGVIGGFEGSGWNTDVPMTKVEGKNEYTATVTLAANDELKVRADGKWADSWGTNGWNGSNFKVEEAGEYVVTIKFESDKVAFTSEGFPGVVTVEKK